MRLVELETIRVDEHPNLLFVRLTSDSGIQGLGETFIGAEAVETILHVDLAPQLLDVELSGVEPVIDGLVPYVGFAGTGAETRARSAVDLALWDLRARLLDMPLQDALGGPVRSSIRTYNTCAGSGYTRARHHRTTVADWGLGDGRDGHEDLRAFMDDAGELARDLLAQGITGMKIWPFDPIAEGGGGHDLTNAELDRALDPFRRIRDAVGNDIEIFVELHGLWDLPAASRIARALEPFEPAWIEDPIRPDDIEALRRLTAQTTIPVAVGETIGGLRAYRDLIAREAADVVIVDLSWCGGLTEAKRVATLASAWNLPVAAHDCSGPVVLTASTHFSMHVAGAAVQESVRAYYQGWYRDLVTELPIIESGRIRPPEGPGLGTQLQPDLTDRPGVHVRRARI